METKYADFFIDIDAFRLKNINIKTGQIKNERNELKRLS